MSLMPTTEKHDFIVLPPTADEPLWRGIIYKKTEPRKGKVFKFVVYRWISIVEHFNSLSDVQCSDFLKTEQPLSTEECLAISEPLEVVSQLYAGSIHRSRDYRI